MMTGRAGQGTANRQTQNSPAQIRPDHTDLTSLKLKLVSLRSQGYSRRLWFAVASYTLTQLSHKPVVVTASAGIFPSIPGFSPITG